MYLQFFSLTKNHPGSCSRAAEVGNFGRFPLGTAPAAADCLRVGWSGSSRAPLVLHPPAPPACSAGWWKPCQTESSRVSRVMDCREGEKRNRKPFFYRGSSDGKSGVRLLLCSFASHRGLGRGSPRERGTHSRSAETNRHCDRQSCFFLLLFLLRREALFTAFASAFLVLSVVLPSPSIILCCLGATGAHWKVFVYFHFCQGVSGDLKHSHNCFHYEAFTFAGAEL